MTQQQPAEICSRERLVRSLDDALSEREEEQLVEHLSDCRSCQNELEQLAAGKPVWTRIGTALRDSDPGNSGLPPTSEYSPQQELEETSADDFADFAVDFLAPPMTEGAVGRLDRIDILEVIGRGGMGVVLKGFEEELNRPVVVKMLAPHLASSGAARKRFAREAQATAVIVHPNVMPILTVNSSGRLPYLVMPFLACESLQQRIDRDGPLEVVDVLRIAHQVACGLAAAHAQGLVHRDVKPANILLERGVDRVLLTDFGLARAADDASLTRTGVIAGTPQFMSPEQARGEAVDARSDLFCLGSVLYTLCAGRPPFRAETSYGVLRRVTDEEPRSLRELNPTIPDWLAGIVKRLHSKEPSRRFQSAEEVSELLERCLAHVQQPEAVRLPDAARDAARLTRPDSTESRATAQETVKKLGWFAGGVAALAAALAISAGDGTRDSGNENSKGSPAVSGAGTGRSEDTGAGASAAGLPAGPDADVKPDKRLGAVGRNVQPQTRQPISKSEKWHDGAREQIRLLRAATDDLESRTSHAWDVRPVGTLITPESGAATDDSLASGKDDALLSSTPSASKETAR